ncbi:MAG: (d)CMP kinase [Akkermansiaceae bacterium]|nr:(d)CMP kinase [Akkermansiaceae bacterium]
MEGKGGTHSAIAIDGPAASGKSTVARMLAERLGLIMVNSGAMYRAVTWEVVRRGIDPSDRGAVAAMLDDVEIACGIDGMHSTVTVDGRDPGAELRSDDVNRAVSQVAAVPEVREVLVAKQRAMLAEGDLIMEGRDIASVVFPETPYKLYIDASEEVRRRRRAAEGQSDEVGHRDRLDSARKTSPLKVADGAVVIDTSDMDIAEVVEAAVAELRQRGWFEREGAEPAI